MEDMEEYTKHAEQKRNELSHIMKLNKETLYCQCVVVSLLLLILYYIFFNYRKFRY